MSRLKLDFSIDNTYDRTIFIQEYLSKPPFDKNPPTDDELEMCGNYILWGKTENGKNVVQNKDIEIETRNKTWSGKKEEQSLDELLETPTFNEQVIAQPTEARTKIPRIVFSREEALKNAPPHIAETLQNLFEQIDRLDLLLNYYDLKHGKRKNPPRDTLLERFSEEESEKIKQKANSLNQFRYLKLRHLLVELRREQFSLKDCYSEPIQRTPPLVEPAPSTTFFESDIPVFPLGLLSEQKVSKNIFYSREDFNPYLLSENDLQEISKFLWEKKKDTLSGYKIYFDFRELEHVYNFFLQYFEMEDSSLEGPVDSTTKNFLDTLNFYVEMAELTEVQREILNLKIKKVKNQEIAEIINKQFQKSYTANYISTIFKQKIIKRINEAASAHLNTVESIFFPEEFKQCSSCRAWLLRDNKNFVKKSRSKDGFANKCKICDKKDRKMRKGTR